MSAFPFGIPAFRPFASTLALTILTGFVLASSLGSITARAQTASIQTLGRSTVDVYSGLISASDGNFYAVSADEEYGGFSPADFGCPDQSSNDCTFIDKITPSGTVTQLHIFETAGFGNNGGAPNNDGFGPTPLVEGPDGYLYGSAVSGGSTGFGTIFKVSTSGTFTLLFTFPNQGTALNPDAPDGAYPSRLIFGKDGNLYGTSQNLNGGYNLFQVTPSGSLTIIASSTVPGDVAPQSIVQGSDGSFYGVNGFSVEQITLSGYVNTLSTFVHNQTQTMQPVGSLVEGPDGEFYGTDGMSNSIFNVSSSGGVNLLHTLSATEGGLISPELTLGSDGNFYGTTYIGGITTACPSGTQAGNGIGCGTVYEMTPSGTFTTLYSLTGTSSDGAQPDGWLLDGSDGSLYGTFFNPSPTANNVMFKLAPAVALPAPIQITFSVNGEPVTTAAVNTPVQLNWSVLNAFSATMQQCHASVLNNALGAGNWSGPQTGSMVGNKYSGSTTITPTVSGTFTYVLNCGGIETGTGTLSVSSLRITTTSLPNGTVSQNYTPTLLQALGGTPPYTWGVVGNFPEGLTIDAVTGLVSGTPKQFDLYHVTIAVTDSANPLEVATQNFTFTIASGLQLTPSLNNAVIGTAYSATATAQGGLPPYKWLLSGSLPPGLTLNPATGVISGTPTGASSKAYTFSITVADSEGTPASTTQSYTISTGVPPLVITEGQFPDCTVNVPCTGSQFDVTGGTPPYTWSIKPGYKFPSGLNITASGDLTGTPKQYSTGGSQYPDLLWVQVTDSESPPVTVSDYDTIDILSGLTISSLDVPIATVGVPYMAPAPAATGGTPPYTWVILYNFTPQITQNFGATPAGVLYSSSPNPPGSYTLTYQVSDSEGTPATASQNATLTINQASATTTTTLTSSNVAAGTGMSVTLTATVQASSGVATGSVTFYNGSATLGTATLNSTGTATLNTSFSSPGVYTLTAQYSGSGTTTGSISAPVTETVVTPTVSAAFSPSTLSVAPGSSGTLTLTLTTNNGYTGTVGLSCGTLPAHISCSFAPPTITISAGQTTATDTLTVSTNSPLVGMVKPPNGQADAREFLAIGLWPFLLLAAKGVRRRSRGLSRLLALAILAAALGALGGCADTPDAAPGTYSIPVTLQLSGGAAQQVSVTVIVK